MVGNHGRKSEKGTGEACRKEGKAHQQAYVPSCIEIISFLTLADHALTIYHLLENGLDTKEIDWMDLNKLRKTGSIY